MDQRLRRPPRGASRKGEPRVGRCVMIEKTKDLLTCIARAEMMIGVALLDSAMVAQIDRLITEFFDRGLAEVGYVGDREPTPRSARPLAESWDNWSMRTGP